MSFGSKLAFLVVGVALIVGLSQNSNAANLHDTELNTKAGVDEDRPVITRAPPGLQAMFDKMKAAAGPLASYAKIYVNQTSNNINAVTWSDDSIVIHKGELIFNIDYPDQLAYVIGHELGHVVLKHLSANFKTCRKDLASERQCEKDADLYGKMLMAKAGYNPCEAAKIWERMIARFGDRDGVTHPRFSERVRYLRCK